MSKPINPDLDSFPDFDNPKPAEAAAPVGHSGNIGLEYPADKQLGPLREQVLSTPEDTSALGSFAVNNAGEAVRTAPADTAPAGTPPVETAPPAPATAPQGPEKRHWSLRTKVIAAGAAVLAIGGAAFGIGKATSGSSEAAPKPGATSESFPPQSADTQPTSSVDLDTNTAAIVAPPQPSVNETAPNTPTTTESDPTLQPIYVEVSAVDKSNASIVLETLLNNVFIGEETGNEDGYKAAFAQVTPGSYGPLQEQVDFAEQHTPAFIAGRAVDPNYPLQSAAVESIQSISDPDPVTGDITIGATTKVTRVIPRPEQGTTEPAIQLETSKTAYIVGKVTVDNFSDGVKRTLFVIKQEYGYSTSVAVGTPHATS